MFCRFATLETNGLLFYNGRFNEKHDFLALEILDGQVVLKYSTGKNQFLCMFVGRIFNINLFCVMRILSLYLVLTPV